MTDRRAAASDTLATSYIISQAVKTVGRFDFVFCGRQAIDGDTAQVGPQTAEKLGVPQVTYLEKVVNIEGNTARLRRNTGRGYEIVDVRLPALITVIETANAPRPQKAKRVFRMKKTRVFSELVNEAKAAMPEASEEQINAEAQRRAEELKSRGLLLEQWNLDDMNADLMRCGLAGSPTKVHRIQAIVLKKEGYTQVEPTEEGVSQLIHELVVDRTLG